MTKQADEISDFLDSKTIESLSTFLEKEKGFEASADIIAVAFAVIILVFAASLGISSGFKDLF